MRRVLHVLDSFDLGGAQEVVLNIASFGSGRYTHEAATLHGRGIYWRKFSDAGVRIHSLSPHKFVPLYIPNLAALLSGGKFDVLHCHLAASNILAKPIGAMAGIRAIINHDHSNDSARRPGGLLVAAETFANRFAGHAIAVSESCRAFLTEHEGMPKEKVSVVLNAIDSARFAPGAIDRGAARDALGISREGPLVCGVGRLNAQKNFSLFLDIATDILTRVPETHFVVAGTGPEERLLRDKAVALGISDRVTFAGYVPDSRRVYAASDVLVMPSRFEGLPMTLLEAMAMEMPFVASRLDGIADIVADGVDGFLATPGDRADFDSKVLAILEGRAPSTGSAARRKICEKFSAERLAADVEAVYDRLLA